ncbi:hypothetical protein OHT76_00665 [Streptomyces sp. NBC_00287]|uniref:hypothetical protein n=1 Tax=Streptomyces sp. NBC_00287 TaxID=2975702 RepID=UPI002E27F7AF|nr:hypothetical protein [Streptomyces sp. NBC_00287]
MLILFGTPDANNDAIPDIWAIRSDGSVGFYVGGRTGLTGNPVQVYGAHDFWLTRIAIG